MDNTKFLNNNNIPFSAKHKKNNFIYNNHLKIIPHPKSHCKRKIIPDKFDEENNINIKINNISHKKSNSLSNFKSNGITENEPQKYKYSNNKLYNYINNINLLNKTESVKILEKSALKEQYDDPNYYITKNDDKEKNIFVKEINIDENDEKNRVVKNKKILSVKNKNQNILFINDNKNNKSNFLYQNNLNNWRNPSRNNVNQNFSLDLNYNNTFHNINNNTHKPLNTKIKNLNVLSTNENSKIVEMQNFPHSTSKINGRTKKMYKQDDIINNEMQNINEFISDERIPIKLEKKSYYQPKIDCFNKKYKSYENIKKIENNKEENILNSNFSNYSKLIPKRLYITNAKFNPKKKNNSSFINNTFDYIDIKKLNKITNSINYSQDNNISQINNIKYKTLKKINNNNNDNCNIKKKNYRINSLETKKKYKTYFSSERKKNNIISNEIYSPSFQEDNFDNINNNINDNINDNNNYNKNYYTKKNFSNERLNNKYNLYNNNSKQKYIKNYSYDLTNINNENNVNIINKKKNLKNFSLKKNIMNNSSINLFSLDKLKTNNLKDLLFNNNTEKNIISSKISQPTLESQNEKKETTKIKESINEKNNNVKIENKTEETLYDESIIVNDSDVYGTLTINHSINNTNKKNNKEKDDKDKDNNTNGEIKEDNALNKIIKYNNFRETISINFPDNKKTNDCSEKEKENKQTKLEDLLKDNTNSNNKKDEIIKVINNNKINNNLYFKSYCSQSLPGKNYGVRKTNQDMPVSYIKLNDINGFNIFGVLDGHGVNGHHVSKFLSEHLVKQIMNNKEIYKTKELDKIYQIIKRSNFELLINIFFESDKILAKQNFDVNFSGTTCVLVIQIGKKLICTNCGDSRAILIYDKIKDDNLKNSEIFELSHDCKPDLPEEKKRILGMGGTVDQMLDINGLRGGPQRVWAKNKNYPGLAMSRSLGDYKGKLCGVIPIPEIIEYELDDKSKYMVICSDGVWEFLSNKKVMEIGNEYYMKNDIIGYTQKLISVSEEWWEKKDVIVDDITAVVVFF